jgi:hypothetical protein
MAAARYEAIGHSKRPDRLLGAWRRPAECPDGDLRTFEALDSFRDGLRFLYPQAGHAGETAKRLRPIGRPGT